jgi:uncharacterized protein (TIGR03435 family)
MRIGSFFVALSLAAQSRTFEVAAMKPSTWVYSDDLYGNDRYEVLATAAGQPSLAHFREMLQELLKERFHLSAHRATKESPSYVLTVNEGGIKMKASVLGAGQSPSSWSSGRVESVYQAGPPGIN